MRDKYTIANLKKVPPHEFQSHIMNLPGQKDAKMEGYNDPNCQRDLSVQFEWGHNHDFGSFFIPGMMGNRHIDILAAFISEYGITMDFLETKLFWMLDVGLEGLV